MFWKMSGFCFSGKLCCLISNLPACSPIYPVCHCKRPPSTSYVTFLVLLILRLIIIPSINDHISDFLLYNTLMNFMYTLLGPFSTLLFIYNVFHARSKVNSFRINNSFYELWKLMLLKIILKSRNSNWIFDIGKNLTPLFENTV